MEEETLEQKQKYLRENVLEKGYDPDKFMEFLTMKKGELGIDLENWTLQELMDVTKEFLSNNKLEIESNLSEGSKEEKEIENENNQEKKETKGNNSENIVNCLLIDQTPITKEKKIEVEVTKPKVEKGGMFSFSYGTYLIVTTPINIQVRRKYTDILWLYNILKSQYINCIVPPFFKKKDKLEKVKMNKRLYFIDKFLNGIAIHPILRNSKIFYDFLSIQNEQEFIKAKNLYNKLSTPTEIKYLKTINGELKVSYSDNNEDYYNGIKSKINAQETIYDNLLYHYKLLLISINQISEQMKEISNIWKELYNQKSNYFESEITEGVYDSYHKVMKEWSNLQKNHIGIIGNSIRRFFKFIREEYNCFKNLSLIVENSKNNYNKKKQKILYAKENYLNQIERNENRMKEQGGSLKKKTEEDKELEFNKLNNKEIIKLDESKKEYGCYLNCYINEFERIRDLNDIRFKENLFGFIKELSSQFSKYSFGLSEIISFIDTLA